MVKYHRRFSLASGTSYMYENALNEKLHVMAPVHVADLIFMA